MIMRMVGMAVAMMLATGASAAVTTHDTPHVRQEATRMLPPLDAMLRTWYAFKALEALRSEAADICEEIIGDQIDSKVKPISFNRCVDLRMRGEI